MFPSLVNFLKNKWLLPFHLFINEIYLSMNLSIHMEAATLRRRRSTADQGRWNTQHLLILLGRQRWREEFAAFSLHSLSPWNCTKSHTLGLFNCLYAIQIQPYDVVALSCMFQRNKTSPRESRAAAGVAALSLHWGNKHAANIIKWRQVKVKWQGQLMMFCSQRMSLLVFLLSWFVFQLITIEADALAGYASTAVCLQHSVSVPAETQGCIKPQDKSPR